MGAEVKQWIISNFQWVFSGIGVVILAGVVRLLWPSLHRLQLIGFRLQLPVVASSERQSLGIIQVSRDWKDFLAPTGVGREFRNRLQQLGNDADWWIITINPEGLVGDFLRGVIIPAVRSGVRLKWTYVRLPDENCCDAEGTLRNWWSTQYTAARYSKSENVLRLAKSNLENNVNEIKRIAQEEIEHGTISRDRIKLYESNVPTTFLGLLATAGADGRTRKTNGIALVYPYLMFPSPRTPCWGMLLENSGDVYKQYADSIVSFFEEGEKRGHLHRIWPEM